MERIVGRSELAADGSVASSTSPEPELLERVKALNNHEYVERVVDNNIPEHSDDAEDELEFRLFSTTDRKVDPDVVQGAIKIHLRSPSPANAEPGFVKASRDEKYYFTGTLSETEKAQFDAAAISGADIVTRSLAPWPGCSYPWKVLHLPLTKGNRTLLSKSESCFRDLTGGLTSTKRRRLGKKTRIKLRVKREATKKRREQEQQSAEEKAVAEREKRNRRNREKKIKRRARERARKAGAGTDDEGLSSD